MTGGKYLVLFLEGIYIGPEGTIRARKGRIDPEGQIWTPREQYKILTRNIQLTTCLLTEYRGKIRAAIACDFMNCARDMHYYMDKVPWDTK